MTNPLPPPPPRSTKVLDTMGLFVQPWSGWFRRLYDYLQNQAAGTTGFTGTVVTAPLSEGGATGEMTFENGILTGVIDPTLGNETPIITES